MPSLVKDSRFRASRLAMYTLPSVAAAIPTGWAKPGGLTFQTASNSGACDRAAMGDSAQRASATRSEVFNAATFQFGEDGSCSRQPFNHPPPVSHGQTAAFRATWREQVRSAISRRDRWLVRDVTTRRPFTSSSVGRSWRARRGPCRGDACADAVRQHLGEGAGTRGARTSSAEPREQALEGRLRLDARSGASFACWCPTAARCTSWTRARSAGSPPTSRATSRNTSTRSTRRSSASDR